MRFVAALMVVITHATFYTQERLDHGFQFWSRGAGGVDIFFVISGFVMIISSQHLSAGEFCLRRLARIVPLYWAVTTVKVFTLLVIPEASLHHVFDVGYIVKSYFFIPAFSPEHRVEPIHGVGWTLLFEMFFYGIFALALYLRQKIVPFVGAVLGICLILAFARKPDWPAWTVYADFRVLDFFLGMLIGVYADKIRLPVVLSVLAIVGGLSGIVFLPQISSFLTPIFPAGLVVLGVVALERPLQSKFPPSLVFLGASSYSLYLIHPLVAPAMPALLSHFRLKWDALSVLGALVAAIILAAGVYRFMEEPLTRFMNTHIKQLYRRPLSPENELAH